MPEIGLHTPGLHFHNAPNSLLFTPPPPGRMSIIAIPHLVHHIRTLSENPDSIKAALPASMVLMQTVEPARVAAITTIPQSIAHLVSLLQSKQATTVRDSPLHSTVHRHHVTSAGNEAPIRKAYMLLAIRPHKPFPLLKPAAPFPQVLSLDMCLLPSSSSPSSLNPNNTHPKHTQGVLRPAGFRCNPCFLSSVFMRNIL